MRCFSKKFFMVYCVDVFANIACNNPAYTSDSEDPYTPNTNSQVIVQLYHEHIGQQFEKEEDDKKNKMCCYTNRMFCCAAEDIVLRYLSTVSIASPILINLITYCLTGHITEKQIMVTILLPMPIYILGYFGRRILRRNQRPE